MAKNTNRDYLVVVDVKSSNIIEQDSLVFYINDNESYNIFVNLVVEDTRDPMGKYVPVDDASKYTVTMNIVKPTNEYERIEAELVNVEDALYLINLPNSCTEYIGAYKCEVETHYETRITTSNKFKYRVKASVLNDLDNIVEAPEYPLVIQLFDKLSDINQYEEDRRQNEVARIAAEIARANTFNALQNDIQDSIEAIDSKAQDMETRTATMENKVNTLITDTKEDLDTYKTAKDAQINQSISSMESTINTYKNEKDQQINEAINSQNSIISEQNSRLDTIEATNTTQNTRLDDIDTINITQNNRLTNIEAKNTEQDRRLDVAENRIDTVEGRLDNIGNDITNTMQPQISSLSTRIDNVEAVNVTQNTRLDAIEIKNQQQDDRLLAIEKHNEKQDIDIKCLFSTVDTIDVTKEGNAVTLQNSKLGFAVIDEIDGNTMVNCNKEADKELVLNGNINTNGYSNVTLTEGVDGGLVDVALEGNTMVNVCDQKDAVAITKSYTVETGNHVALQGEYDGKCRPVVTGNTLVNIYDMTKTFKMNSTINDNIITFDTSKGDLWYVVNNKLPALKTSTTYTIILNIIENTIEHAKDKYLNIEGIFNNSGFTSGDTSLPKGFTGIYKVALTTKNEFTTNYLSDIRLLQNSGYTGKISFSVIILEGDYTNKPIPGYFEGLQSSFEDKLVTQEMVDAGEELAENLGKYKVDYVVTGKNKFSKDRLVNQKTLLTTIKKGEKYTFSYDYTEGNTGDNRVQLMTTPIIQNPSGEIENRVDYAYKNSVVGRNSITITSSIDGFLYLRIVTPSPTLSYINNFQLEEGTVATSYEPYKEYKKTFYLNSPLLEGDTIEESGGNVVHVHRSEIRAYQTDDELTSPTDMINTLATKSPTYEVISTNDTILCDSYVNGHLDVDSAVPIEKVVFNRTSNMKNKYLYPSTEYIIQFESDNIGKIDILQLADKYISSLDIVKGINKFKLTTYSSINNILLKMDGIGFNASNIVVTQATDQDFGYFEGMKSVGECEDLKITTIKQCISLTYFKDVLTAKPMWKLPYNEFISYAQYFNEVTSYSNCKNKYDFYYVGTASVWIFLDTFDKYEAYIEFNSHIKSNTQQLPHEPLRAVGDVKDKYVLIDGKWYIERNCKQVNFKDIASSVVIADTTKTNTLRFKWKYTEELNFTPKTRFKSDTFKYALYSSDEEGIDIGDDIDVSILKSRLASLDKTGVIQWLNNNPVNLTYIRKTPTYEPIDYNPFTVYSDVTRISNNSTIPANMVIKNTGYNCMLKPSTTYTVSSNQGINVITTPSTLTEDCLRFYDSDTSTVTTMKNVMVLEGDYTTNGKPMPSHFPGIESSFEQEYDEEVGKYKVKAVVRNEEGTKEHSIEFYIDEPLRGIRDVKDKVYSDGDKIVIQRNCGVTTLDGSENWVYGKTISPYIEFRLPNSSVPSSTNVPSISNKFTNLDMPMEKLVISYQTYYLQLHSCRLQTQDVSGFKQWLQQNPTTVAYQLASPTYEVIDYPDAKLLLDIFPNSTLYYENNVPVTSTVRYTYSNPVIEQVNAVREQVSNLGGNDVVLMNILDEEVNK